MGPTDPGSRGSGRLNVAEIAAGLGCGVDAVGFAVIVDAHQIETPAAEIGDGARERLVAGDPGVGQSDARRPRGIDVAETEQVERRAFRRHDHAQAQLWVCSHRLAERILEPDKGRELVADAEIRARFARARRRLD